MQEPLADLDGAAGAFSCSSRFGVIPLLGVLALSFTHWDGIGPIIPAGLDSWRVALTDPGLPHALVGHLRDHGR